MTKEAKYFKAITTKFPKEVWDAMEKRVAHKQKKFARYAEADLIRTAVVNHLKNKSYLEKNKDYL
jgi:hypothetical protein